MAQSAKKREPKLVDPDPISEVAPEVAIPQEMAGESVADTLIRARQQYGQDLRSIAQVLCIRYSYLDAIERANYENLPGPTYAVGFVRTYAEFLGLDGDAVVERFKNEVQGLDGQTKLHFPTPAPEGKMPGGAVFLVAALIFAGAYGVWFYLSNQGETIADLVSPVPERLQEMVAEETPASTPGEAPTAVAESPAAVPAPATAGLGPAPIPASEAAQTAGESPAQSAVAEESTPSPTVPVQAEAEAADRSSAAPEEPAPVAAATPAPVAPDAAGSEAAPPEIVILPQPPAASSGPAAATTNSGNAATQPDGGTSPVIALKKPEPPLDEAAAGFGQQQAGNSGLAGRTNQSAYDIPTAPASSQTSSFLVNQEPRVYGSDNADARIVLKASQDAWVQVRDREGTLLLTRVLRVGDSYRVPNQEDLTLLTGNAGGLEILVDGTALAPLGPVGAVRRNIPLDPEKLLNGTGG